MFYTVELFVKKGPLGTLWLAGNLIRKLSKSTILSSDVVVLCNSIAAPPAPLALPTQSTLLRGVVRIENKKIIYLLEDAMDARAQATATDRLKIVEPAERRKLVAKTEQITYDESENQMMSDELINMGMLEDYDLLMSSIEEEEEELEGERLFLSETLSQEEAPHIARARDITITPTEELRGRISVEMPRAEGERAGYELEEEMPIPSIPPSPIERREVPFELEEMEIEERAPSLEEEEEERKIEEKPKRKKRRGLLATGAKTELTDMDIRYMLEHADDLSIDRPQTTRSLKEFHQQIQRVNHRPAILGLQENAEDYIAEELLEMWRDITVPSEEQIRLVKEEKERAERGRRAPGAPPSLEEEFGVPEFEIPEAIPPEELEFEYPREEGFEREPSLSRTFLGRPLTPLVSPLPPPRRRTILEYEKEPVPSQELEVPLSEFELQYAPEAERAAERERETIERREVDEWTRAFREAMEEQFIELEKKYPRIPRREQTLMFEDLLKNAAIGKINRRDRAIAFYQLLVHKSLDVIDVKQEEPYGDIAITRSNRWDIRFSESGMFSASQ